MTFGRRGNLVKNILWLQWIAGVAVMMMQFTVGLMFGWTSPYLSKLTAEDSPLPITREEASWVASLFNLGRFIGAIIGGTSVYYFDSKRTLIIAGFPVLFNWICIILANSVTWLYVARIAAGMTMGMSFSSFPLYLGEISSPAIRGGVVSLALTGTGFGNLIGNVFGSYMSMALFSYVSLVPNVLFIIIFFWLPQSPYFLVRHGRIKDAEEAMARYNPNVDPRTEVESLKNFINTTESLTLRDRLREFNIPRNRKAGFIILMLYLFMQISGLNSVVFYTEIILINGMVDVISPPTVVMLASACGVVSGWSSIYLADKFERKVLIMASTAAVGLCLFVLGLHFVLLDNSFHPDELQWLAISTILVYTFAVWNGITTVPSMLLSEFFAPNIKSLAACFASVAIGLFAFGATKTYQPLVDLFGEAYVLWVYAATMVVCIIFCAFLVPKTKGKSLQEIQDTLMRT